MTEDEKQDYLAREVMGWGLEVIEAQPEAIFNATGTYAVWLDRDGNPICEPHNWNPFSSTEQAMGLLKATGRRYTIDHFPTSPHISSKHYKVSITDNGLFTTSGNELEPTICETVLDWKLGTSRHHLPPPYPRRCLR